jgi:hypothetical protein
MKLPVMTVLAVVLSLLPGSWCSAQNIYKFALPANNEPIYGTWINKDYSGNVPEYAQMYVYYIWGFGETYNRAIDVTPSEKWTYILVEKWTDQQGNTWYKEYAQSADSSNYSLDRISKDGSVMETLYNMRALPQERELDPKNYDKYRIYYRR